MFVPGPRMPFPFGASALYLWQDIFEKQVEDPGPSSV